MKKVFALSFLLITCAYSTISHSGSQVVLANPSNLNGEGVGVDITTASGSYILDPIKLACLQIDLLPFTNFI
jgi:RNA 3'-terminal phosphate cyclase